MLPELTIVGAGSIWLGNTCACDAGDVGARTTAAAGRGEAGAAVTANAAGAATAGTVSCGETAIGRAWDGATAQPASNSNTANMALKRNMDSPYGETASSDIRLAIPHCSYGLHTPELLSLRRCSRRRCIGNGEQVCLRPTRVSRRCCIWHAAFASTAITCTCADPPAAAQRSPPGRALRTLR